MSTTIGNDCKILRKGSYRLLGPIFILISGFSAFMLYREEAELIKWTVPLLFLMGGFWFSFRNTSYILYREDKNLIWNDHAGDSASIGNVYIPDILRLEVYKMRPIHKLKRPATRLQLELVLKDGKRISISRNLGLGGPGNPNYDDVIEELRKFNPFFELEVLEVEGWRKTYS